MDLVHRNVYTPDTSKIMPRCCRGAVLAMGEYSDPCRMLAVKVPATYGQSICEVIPRKVLDLLLLDWQ